MMYSTAFLTLVAASLASAQSFVVNSATGALTQCQPYSITWTGGTAPFFPTINEAGSLSAVIKRFPQTNAQNELWTVDLPVGQAVTFAVTDSTGMTMASAPSNPIQAGTSTDCLNSSTSSAPVGGVSTAGSSSAASSSSASSSATSAASTTRSSTTGPSSTASRSSNTSSAQSPTNTANNDNGAMNLNLRSAAALAAGLVGVVAAALI